MRAQMSETVLFGKIKDPEFMVLTYRGELQCRMGGKREDPIEAYPKFWKLNSLERQAREVLKIPTWTEAFDLIRKELDMFFERDKLLATLPEFPTVRQGK